MAPPPPRAPGGLTAVVWIEPQQVDLARAVMHAAGLRVIGAGCPQLGRAREVAEAFGTGVAALDDLRQAVTSSDADVLLLASPGDFGAGGAGGGGILPVGPASAAGGGAGGLDDWAVLEDRRARGGAVFTLEPMPASVLQIQSPTLTPAPGSALHAAGVALGPGQGTAPLLGGEWATFAPLFSRGPAMRIAADVLAHMGPIHSAAAEFLAGPGEGSLGARLFDAVEALTSIMGEPESVDAAYIWPGRARIVHPVVGESLRGLAGALTANLRFADGRGASVLAGDASVGAAGWSRRLTLISEAGRLVVTDSGLEHVPAADAASGARDAGAEDPTAAAPGGIVAALADQITRALDRSIPPPPPVHGERVLAATGAALLSARTGEAESPETILRMARTA